jgi:hypothetical protein
MRLLPLLVVGLALAGCSAAQDAASPPGSAGSEPVVTVPTTQGEVDPASPRPPAIVLTSENGEQEAVQGSSCVEYVDPDSGEGQGSCGDSGPIHPTAVTGLTAGDEVAFVLDGAKVVRASGCHGGDEQDCIGSVSVKPLGCEKPEVESVPLVLGPKTRWTVDLEPGAYELDVLAYFESDSGATGDVSGSVGITVAGGKKWDVLGVQEIKPSMQVCAYDAVAG